MTVRTVGALVVMLLAAGCVSSDGETTPAATSEQPSRAVGTDALAPSIIVDPIPPGTAPIWQVGDSWAITTSGSTGEAQETLVVSAVDTDSYTVSTTGERTAMYDALYDVSFVGKLRARDLAGGQNGNVVQFFDFPLEDGKTWSTTWDGFGIHLTSVATPTGFSITGTRDGEPYVVYDYSPAHKWWSSVEFVEEGFTISLAPLRSDWRGTLVTATADLIFESTAPAPTLDPAAGAFTVDEGQTRVLVTLQGGGALWARGLVLIDPTGTPHLTDSGDAETGEGSFHYEEELLPTPGEWHIAAPMLRDPDAWGRVTVHQIALETRAFP